jgi:hypothetical protein
MIRTTITTAIISLLIISCNGQSSKIINEDKSFSINKNQTKIEMEILSDYAKENSLKKISYEEFRNKCSLLFGIELDSSTNSDSYINIGNNTEYSLSTTGQFLNVTGESLFYQPEIEGKVSKEQAKKFLNDSKNGIGTKFIAYNKLLFNDDVSTLNYFVNNIDECRDVIFNLDYENNNNLITLSTGNFGKDNFYEDNLENILFYNNQKRGFKKKVLEIIYKRCSSSPNTISYFEDFIYKYHENFLKLNYSQKTKDECLVYLIELLIDFDENNIKNIASINDEKAYVHLSNFLIVDNKLHSRLASKNYYNNLKIKGFVEFFKLDDENSEDNTFYISDPDGYTNLRKEKNTTSSILEKVKTGESVEVIEQSGDWYLVKTKAGNQGYVYKTKIKVE